MKTKIHKKDQYCAGPNCDCGYKSNTTHTPGPLANHQNVSSRAVAYCDRKGYKQGPARKLAYQAYVAALQEIAAPELLEALKELSVHMRGKCDHETSEECNKAMGGIVTNAIAKAEGRE